MPTYVYRTCPPADSGVEPWDFEVKQSIHDQPLSVDPDSGFAVKRVITGGHVQSSGVKRGGGGGCCGGGCGCH
jgi:hypothetical protein